MVWESLDLNGYVDSWKLLKGVNKLAYGLQYTRCRAKQKTLLMLWAYNLFLISYIAVQGKVDMRKQYSYCVAIPISKFS